MSLKMLQVFLELIYKCVTIFHNPVLSKASDPIMPHQPGCLLFSPVFALRRKGYVNDICQNTGTLARRVSFLVVRIPLLPLRRCPWSMMMSPPFPFLSSTLLHPSPAFSLSLWSLLFVFFCFYHAAATGSSKPREKKIQGRDLQVPGVTTSYNKSHIAHQSCRCAHSPEAGVGPGCPVAVWL